MRIVAGTRLESRSVRRSILARYADKPQQFASRGQAGDPARCLAALVDDDVDPEPRKVRGEIGDVGQDRALERGVGVEPADGTNNNDQAILASHQPVARPASL